MLSLSRPPVSVRPVVVSKRPRRLRTKADMGLFGTMCGAVAVYSSIMWYDARLKRTRAEGKPMWPWEEK